MKYYIFVFLILININAFAKTCDITMQSSFLTVDIYNKDGGEDVYGIIKNSKGRYDATFELYNIKGCRSVASGTMDSYSSVSKKISESGYKEITSMSSGSYKDVSGDISLKYILEIKSDEIVIEYIELSSAEKKFFNSIIENPNSLGLNNSEKYKNSTVFESETFWANVSNSKEPGDSRKYFIDRWTLDMKNTSDLELFLGQYQDDPDWQVLVASLMSLKFGELSRIDALSRFAVEYPKNSYATLAAAIVDENAYNHAKNTNTVESFEKYLAEHNTGGFAGKASLGLNDLKYKKNKKIALTSGSIIVVAKIFGQYPDDREIKNKLIKLYKEQNNLDGYKKVYKLSGKSEDLNVVLKYSNSISELKIFITSYTNKEIVGSAKQKLLVLYRKQNSLDGYKKAYDLAKETEDLNKVLKYSNSIPELEDFIKSYKNTKVATSAIQKLTTIYRNKNNLDGYKKAYELARETDDLNKILTYSNTIPELEKFIKSYKNTKVVTSAKQKLTTLYRNKNNFTGYLSAYKLLSNVSDGKQALLKANTSVEKAELEEEVFQHINGKTNLFTYKLNLNPATYSSDQSDGGGFLSFSKRSFSQSISVGGKVTVKLNDNTPYTPQYGVYRVVINLTANIKRSKEVRSSWIGNSDTDDDFTKQDTITLVFKPPYNATSETFYMADNAFVYFDRGSAGGYTAKWPSDNVSIKIDQVKVDFLKSESGENKKMNIDFDLVNKFNSSFDDITQYVQGSLSKGVASINNFSEIDVSLERSYSASSYSNDTPSSNASTSSNNSHSNSSGSGKSQKKNGVKELYDGGYKSPDGSIIYVVKCTSGGKYSGYKKSDGYWFDGSSNYGDRYRNLSTREFANKRCNY